MLLFLLNAIEFLQSNYWPNTIRFTMLNRPFMRVLVIVDFSSILASSPADYVTNKLVIHCGQQTTFLQLVHGIFFVSSEYIVCSLYMIAISKRIFFVEIVLT